MPSAPFIDFPFRLFLAIAVGSLQGADQLILVSCNLRQLVVGQFAPLFTDLSFESIPIAYYLVPVHDDLINQIELTEKRLQIPI